MSLWSFDELRLARQMNRSDASPVSIAQKTGHTVKEVDLALWCLLGRDVAEACDTLNLAQLDNVVSLHGQGRGEANNLSALAAE